MSRWPAVGACFKISVAVVVTMLVLQMDARGTSIQSYIPIELYTPFAPRPFEGSDGKTHLAYEVHITNFYRDTGAIVLEELQIAHGTAGTRLVELDAADLDERVKHPGAEPESLYGRSIEGGMRAVVHIWVTLQPGAATPESLFHRVVLYDDRWD